MGSGIVHEHALTRTVRDSAALLDATSGPEPGDPYYVAPPERPFLEEVGRDAGRLTIGFLSRIPEGWNEDNIPIGVQFAGRYGEEATLFRLAAQLEQARPWAEKIPPIHCCNAL